MRAANSEKTIMSDPFSSPRPGTPSRPAKAAAAPKPAPVVKPVPQPVVASPPPEREPVAVAEPASLPQDFVFDAEHPVMPVPFTVQIGDARLEGEGLSVAAAYVAIEGSLDPAWVGHKQVVKLQVDFRGFSVVLFPECVVAGSRQDGEMTLQFMDPAGPHLPQLRYILNSFIAGDAVSVNGLLSYTGPTSVKPAKSADAKPTKFRVRSAAVAFLSLCLLITTGYVMLQRATQSYELRPVFVERLGQDMKATTAGQVSFLNPAAKKGEVVFSVNSNSGDVLNFQLPCDCEVAVTEGIYQGATVLPIDSILSFFEPKAGVRVQTQMSIDGLGKAMGGEQAYLDMSDGRSLPVKVVLTSATNAAMQRGDLFVPVDLVPADGVLTAADIGKSAHLRLQRPWLNGSLGKF